MSQLMAILRMSVAVWSPNATKYCEPSASSIWPSATVKRMQPNHDLQSLEQNACMEATSGTAQEAETSPAVYAVGPLLSRSDLLLGILVSCKRSRLAGNRHHAIIGTLRIANATIQAPQ